VIVPASIRNTLETRIMDCLVCGMQVAQLHNVHVGQIVPPSEANEQLCFCGAGSRFARAAVKAGASRPPRPRAATALTRRARSAVGLPCARHAVRPL
jgi:hypothetical protein